MIERKLEKDAFFIAKSIPINSLKDIKRATFSSDLDTSDGGATYTLEIQGESIHGKLSKSEKKFPVTMFFDEYGYLHRYKVKELFEESLKKFINSK